MSEAIVAQILTQLATIREEQIRKEMRLRGIEKEIKKLESELKSLGAVLDDAERRQLKDKEVKVWLKRLQDVCYEAEDVLDEFNYAVLKAEIQGHGSQSSPLNKKRGSFFNLLYFRSKRFVLHHDTALKIKKINKRLANIATEKHRYKFIELSGDECLDWPRSASFTDVSEAVGVHEEKNILISKLLSDKNQEKDINIVSIVGAPGIGKTTLAQLVYNSDNVKQHFDMKIWACASDPFDEVQIAKAILEAIEGGAQYLLELETVARKIRNYVQGKRFLLVLDDVWTEDFRRWEPLFNSLNIGAAGSTILLTTSNENVAKLLGSGYLHRLRNLSEVHVDRPRSASFTDLSEVVGLHEEKNTLISKLLPDKNEEKDINIVSIVAAPGIGKTTLAKLVYNSNDVKQHFAKRIWVCVSDRFDEVQIAKSILEAIVGGAQYFLELETVARKIRNYLQGKRFLLVLDDVWTEDFRKWEPLFNSLNIGAAGSTILLTTRNERVAKVLGSNYVLHLGNLSEVESWSLLKQMSFSGRKEEKEYKRFEDVGRLIAKKCKGFPLAVKAIGSVLRFKNSLEEWEDVLNSEFWELEEAGGLFSPLMLSYHALPSRIKRCFVYCAIFPKGHVIGVNDLIQLWMAQGFLNSTESVEMEVIGQEYLRSLAMTSLLQDLVRDKKNGERILSLKIHDVVHDFANYLTENECLVVEFNDDFRRRTESTSHKGARHLTVVRAGDTPFPSIPNAEKLFTLQVRSSYNSPSIKNQPDQIDPDLIRRLECLRALDLSRNKIVKLPKEIGNLIKLRYLNLSQNPFWELADTLCALYLLQTLNLYRCDQLRRLPSRICNLVNLRHLEIDHTDSLKTLPKGIGKLVSLQTLSKFIITPGVDRGEATCGLEDLKNLNNLRGSLKIEGLVYVADADKARRADLQKKIHLSGLEMDFSPSVQIGNQDEVLEALEVHENLQSLQISSYGGTKFPNWMMKLPNLKNLFLQDCQICTNLPALGRLPSLVTLHLEGMNSINCLGLEFLGIDVKDNSTMDGEARSAALSAFPNLEKLKISKMGSWEEWNLISKDSGIPNENFTIMPRLRSLKISHCSKLKALPPLLLEKTTLRKLHIQNCPLLQLQYNRKTGEDWSNISTHFKFRVS